MQKEVKDFFKKCKTEFLNYSTKEIFLVSEDWNTQQSEQKGRNLQPNETSYFPGCAGLSQVSSLTPTL